MSEDKGKPGTKDRGGILGGLRAKVLAIMLCVALLPLLGSVIYGLKVGQDNVLIARQAELNTAAAERANFASAWFEARKAFVTQLADVTFLTEDKAASSTRMAQLVRDSRLGVVGISLVDGEGRTLAGAGEGLTGFDVASLGPVAGEEAEAKGTVNLQDGRVGLLFEMIAETGVEEGRLLVLFDTNSLFNNLQQELDPEDGSLARNFYLIGSDGRILGGEALSEKTGEALISPAVERLVGNESGVGIYENHLGTRVMGAYMPLPELGLGLLVEADYAAVSASGRAMQRLTYLGIGIVSIAVILVSFFFANSLVRPIVTVTGQLESIASGGADLTQRLEVRSGDELGRLAGAFNTLMDSLAGLIQEVRDNSLLVLQTAEEIARAIKETDRVTEQIASAVGGVAAGAQDQTQHVQDISRKVDNLAQVIEAIAREAQEQAARTAEAKATLLRMADGLSRASAGMEEVAQDAAGAAMTASNGEEVMEESLKGMEETRSTVAAAGEKVRHFGVLSGQIASILEVISEIADQTNLLALNAAIEAARAGEHGKGFAVVADEVRKLAERSGQAAKEIGQLVAGIRRGTEEAVSAMEAGMNQVVAGVSLSQQARESLSAMLKMVNETNARSQEILALVREVAQGGEGVKQETERLAAMAFNNQKSSDKMTSLNDEVVMAIASIASVSEQNAAAAQQVSASVQQQSATVHQVASSAERLAKTAQVLSERVSRFKF